MGWKYVCPGKIIPRPLKIAQELRNYGAGVPLLENFIAILQPRC
jgi:hypothetical protein